MKNTKKLTVLSMVLLFSLISSLVFPISVLADDTTPPPAETSEVSPPIEEEVATEEPVIAEATEVPVTDEAPATEEPVSDDPSPAAPAETEASVSDEAPQAEEAGEVDLTEIVQAAAENELVLADSSGEPLGLGTVEAAETLATGDPYFTRGGTIYRFLPVGGCAAYGGISPTCIESATPIQAALNDVELNGSPDDNIVRVEPGIYAEQITISIAGLTLMGLPGLVGAGVNAPVIQGSGSGSGTGVTINAGGVTLTGFVIQGWDQAIWAEILTGNTAATIEKNTIQNNQNGIQVVGGQGKPGTNIRYNIFTGNTIYDLVNTAPDANNVQNVDATNNYWGCASGPVVAYKKYGTGNQKDVFLGWAYIDWATKYDYGLQGDGDDPDPNCAVLYGSDSLYDHGLPGNGEYKPYKIIIGSLAPPPATEPPPTEPPTEPPPTETPTEPPPPTETPTEPPPPTETPTEPPTETPTEPPPTETPTETPPTEPPATETPTQPSTGPTPTETPAAPLPAAGTPAAPRPSPSTVLGGFVPVTGGKTHAIAAGIAHTCAITPEGGVQCWGNNDFGQLGDGTNTSSNIPVDVAGIGGGTTIVAGGNHTCVLSGSEVWCWGQNSQGQLGDGTRTDRNVPVKVLSDAVGITAGLDYTCAVLNYGQVMCWGDNDQGQLADGTKTDRTTPTLASLISGISKVDAGWNKSCGLTGAGLLKCLSGGSIQELGGVPGPSLDVAVNRFSSLVMALIENGVPVAFQSGQFKTIRDVSNAVDVDSGLGHVCALLSDGSVQCWGSNYYGQLGRGSKASSQDPQPVVNLSGAWQLAVGKYHACVLITSSTPGTDDIQCWGLNKDGQLGNGTNENSPIPVLVK